MSAPSAATAAPSPDELLRQLEQMAAGGTANGNSNDAAQTTTDGGGKGDSSSKYTSFLAPTPSSEAGVGTVASPVMDNGAFSSTPIHGGTAWNGVNEQEERRSDSQHHASTGDRDATTAAAAAPQRHSSMLAAVPPPVSMPQPQASPAAAAAPSARSGASSRIRVGSFSKPQQPNAAAAAAAAESAQAERMRALALSELGIVTPAPSPAVAASSSSSSFAAMQQQVKRQHTGPAYAAPIRTISKSTLAAVAAKEAAQRAAEEQEMRLMQVGPPRARPMKKKPQQQPQQVTSPTNVAPAYSDLLPARAIPATAAGSSTSPTLLHCSQALVHVLRALQSSSATDATAVAELQQLLAEHPLTDDSDNGDVVASLQREQDVIGDALAFGSPMAPLEQLPSGGADGIDQARMRDLFRWHLAHTPRRSGAARTASAIPGTPSRSSAASGPAVVNISLSSSAAPSVPASGQRSPAAGGHGDRASAAPAAATAAAGPPVSMQVFGSARGDTSVSSSGAAYSVSDFLSATGRPLPAAAAQPIPVRKDRYADLPSRLLDHFKERSLYRITASGAQTDRARSSRSRSTSRTRGDTTPRGGSTRSRSGSVERGAASSSSSVIGIPNHALRSSRSEASFDAAAAADLESLEREIELERTALSSTSLRPRNSSSANTPRVEGFHSRGVVLSDSVRGAPAPYTNKPSVQPPSLSVAQFSPVDNKMQIRERMAASSKQQQRRSDEEFGALPSDLSDAAEGEAAAAAAAGSSSGDASAAAAAAAAGMDIVLPSNLNDMVAEIESMNASLEALLAREAAQERANGLMRAQREQRRRSQALHEGLQRPSSARSRSSSRSSSFHFDDEMGPHLSIREASLRHPRVVFPGSEALYADDPEQLQAVRASAARRSRSRTRRGLDPAAPAHLYSPARADPLSPGDFPGQRAQGHAHMRAVGPPPTPQARPMSFLDYETNLRHQQAAESWRHTIDAQQQQQHRAAPGSRRRSLSPSLASVASSSALSGGMHSPRRSDAGSIAGSVASSSTARARSLTPQASPRRHSSSSSFSGGVPLRREPLVPQARPMGYLSPAANAELRRQATTWQTTLAGASTGSAQKPVRFVRSRRRSVTPDARRIVDRRTPQARHMAFLPPEVNAAHIQAARTWRPKIEGQFASASPRGAPAPFRYDPATDPYLRKSKPRPIITQARGMGYLPPEVNAKHFRAAQVQEARAGLQPKHGRQQLPQRQYRPQQQQQYQQGDTEYDDDARNEYDSRSQHPYDEQDNDEQQGRRYDNENDDDGGGRGRGADEYRYGEGEQQASQQHQPRHQQQPQQQQRGHQGLRQQGQQVSDVQGWDPVDHPRYRRDDADRNEARQQGRRSRRPEYAPEDELEHQSSQHEREHQRNAPPHQQQQLHSQPARAATAEGNSINTPLARTPLRSSLHASQHNQHPPPPPQQQQQPQQKPSHQQPLPSHSYDEFEAAPTHGPVAAAAAPRVITSPARRTTTAHVPDLSWASPSSASAHVASSSASATAAASSAAASHDAGSGEESSSPSPRRQMTPAAAERHAAQARAFEDAEREWANLSADHDAIKQQQQQHHPHQKQQHQQQQQHQRPQQQQQLYHHERSKEPPTPFDDEPSGPHPPTAASSSSMSRNARPGANAFDVVQQRSSHHLSNGAAPVASAAATSFAVEAEEPVLESFDSDEDLSLGTDEEEEETAGSEAASEADLYSYYRSQRAAGTGSAGNSTAAAAAASYDPLAAEQATLAAGRGPLAATSVKPTPTLRPSRRQQ